MKKILILVDKIGNKKKNLVKCLDKNLDSKAEIVLDKFSNLIFEIYRKKIEIKINQYNIKDFDLIYFRRVGGSSWAGSLATYLDSLKIKYFDTTFDQLGPAGNKLNSLLQLRLAGLPIPPTFFCWKHKIIEQTDNIIDKIGFPLIAKSLFSQRGNNIFLVERKKDFQNIINTENKDQFLFQRFFPQNEEYRILVLGGKAVVWEKKINLNKKEFRNNITLGAKEEFLDIKDIPKEIEKIAIRAAQVRNIEIAGVDILVDKKTKKSWLLEVNRGPEFTYNSKISPELTELSCFFANQLGVKL